jgi:hypothetical protein
MLDPKKFICSRNKFVLPLFIFVLAVPSAV